MLRNLVLLNRSYRRFVESEAITEDTLRELIELVRCVPSAGNLQPLKYYISCVPETNELIFPALAWAGYLKEWAGPAEGERPSAYVVILGDTDISKGFSCDHGIAAQTILLGATEKGYGGCMIGAIDRDLLRKNLAIPECYEILLVLALGKPAETVVLEDVGKEGSIKYYRDADSVHHVPKRNIDELVVKL